MLFWLKYFLAWCCKPYGLPLLFDLLTCAYILLTFFLNKTRKDTILYSYQVVINQNISNRLVWRNVLKLFFFFSLLLELFYLASALYLSFKNAENILSPELQDLSIGVLECTVAMNLHISCCLRSKWVKFGLDQWQCFL